MPRLVARQADFGVCIHEGRFTWEQQGLFLVDDLGTLWERETNCPLPLGGIVVSKELPLDVSRRVQSAIRASLEYGLQHREETLNTMRHYAQEFDDSVLMQHVELYVNEWTLDLGDRGQLALERLSKAAATIGNGANSQLQVLTAS